MADLMTKGCYSFKVVPDQETYCFNCNSSSEKEREKAHLITGAKF